jgi:hypothetical protein
MSSLHAVHAGRARIRGSSQAACAPMSGCRCFLCVARRMISLRSTVRVGRGSVASRSKPFSPTARNRFLQRATFVTAHAGCSAMSISCLPVAARRAICKRCTCRSGKLRASPMLPRDQGRYWAVLRPRPSLTPRGSIASRPDTLLTLQGCFHAITHFMLACAWAPRHVRLRGRSATVPPLGSPTFVRPSLVSRFLPKFA